MQKYSFDITMVFYYDSLKNIVDIFGKLMDGFMPLDSSTRLGTLSSVTTGLFIQHSIVTSGEGQDTNYIFSSFQGLLSLSWMWSLFSLKLPVAWQEGRRSLYHIMKGS